MRVPFVIIAQGPKDPIYLTTYRDNVVGAYTTPSPTLDEISRLISLAMAEHEYREFIAMPIANTIDFLLQNRAVLEAELSCVVSLPHEA